MFTIHGAGSLESDSPMPQWRLPPITPMQPSPSEPLAAALEQQLEQTQVEITHLRLQLEESQAVARAQVAELDAAKAAAGGREQQTNELRELLIVEASRAVQHAEKLVVVEGRLLRYKRALEEREATESERVEHELAKRLRKMTKVIKKETEAAAGVAVQAARGAAEKAATAARMLREKAKVHVKEKKRAREQAKRLSVQLDVADKKLRLLESESSKFFCKLMEVGESTRPIRHARSHTLIPSHPIPILRALHPRVGC